jgi:hypothetical protein
MAWKREKFTIAGAGGDAKIVSGWTSSGLGVHRRDSRRDSLGRQRWVVTNLNSGQLVLYLNGKDATSAVKTADLIVNKVDWEGIVKPEEIAEKDPEWLARLLGIKHTLGGDWMEFPNPAMNDPANSVMIDHNMTRQQRTTWLCCRNQKPAVLVIWTDPLATGRVAGSLVGSSSPRQALWVYLGTRQTLGDFDQASTVIAHSESGEGNFTRQRNPHW